MQELIGEESIACPSCKAKQLQCLGTIPASNVFAGRRLDRILHGGALWRCTTCHLVFRYPRLPKQELDDLYSQGSVDNWNNSVETRADWILTAKIIASYAGVKRVLDVGCFDGKLLSYLDSSYEKLGVEIHEEAATRAEARNIRIIARDIDELGKHRSVADAVLAMDVIEHAHDPFNFLALLAQAARPGGLVIVATGNADSSSWRLMGSRYWYCNIAEHISFINKDWAYKAADALRLEVISVQTFSHGDHTLKLGMRFRQVLLNLFYRFSPWLFSKVRQIHSCPDVECYPVLLERPPSWMAARDHILVVFRKRDSDNSDPG